MRKSGLHSRLGKRLEMQVVPTVAYSLKKLSVEQCAKRRLPRVCVHIGLREPECCPNSLLGRGDAPVDLESTDEHACRSTWFVPNKSEVFPRGTTLEVRLPSQIWQGHEYWLIFVKLEWKCWEIRNIGWLCGKCWNCEIDIDYRITQWLCLDLELDGYVFWSSFARLQEFG